MTEDEIDALISSTIPDEVVDLLLLEVELPILSNEDRDRYYEMILLFAKSIKPGDFIAWMLVQDLTDHRIEIARYRRLKIALLQKAARERIASVASDRRSSLSRELNTLHDRAKKQKEEFAKQNTSAEKIANKNAEIDAELAAADTRARADAQKRIDELNAWEPTDNEFAYVAYDGGALARLDDLLRAAEDRFIATVYEVERHLAGLGARFREELEAETRKVIDLVPSAGARPGAAAGAQQAGLALSDRRKPQTERRSRGGR